MPSANWRRWREAEAAYAAAIERGQDDVSVWYSRALLALRRGDPGGYRATCAEALRRFGGAEPALTAGMTALTCALAPDAGVDLVRAVRLAERAVAVLPGNYTCRLALGAVLYRAGRWQEAVRHLDKAAARQSLPVSAWLLLALAHQHLGHAGQARQWLDRAAAHLDRPGKVQRSPGWNESRPDCCATRPRPR